MNFRVSIDSGGTFTDGVLIDEKGEVVTTKAHTTPQDLTLGTIECLSRLASLSGMDSRIFWTEYDRTWYT
jgi:N-methylhydantoinase A